MIDLAKKPDEELQQKQPKFTTLEDFLQTGECKHCSGNYPLVFHADADAMFTVIDGWLYVVGDGAEAWDTHLRQGEPFKIDPRKVRADNSPEGRLMPGKGNYKWSLARNGDLAEESGLLEFKNEDLYGPTFSFRCLARFLTNSDDDRQLDKVAMNALVQGQVELVDFLPDEIIKVDPKIRKARQHNTMNTLRSKYRSPKVGFTLVDHDNHGLVWHRPATTLFHVKGSNNSLILGQDGPSYFGCELPVKAETVKDAMYELAPVEARNGKGLKAGVLRQGEWFAIPCDEKSVPTLQTCAVWSEEPVIMPLDTPDSNRHYLSGDEVRVSKDGQVFARCPRMEHSEEQHEELDGEDDRWYVFRHNTALRSFSQQGVD